MAYIWLAALERRVSIPSYMKAIRRAKEVLHGTFPNTLETWWSGSGECIVAQFRKALHKRISAHLPGYGKGRKWDEIYQTEQMRDCQAVRRAVKRVRIYQLMTPELRRRFKHLLSDLNEL